MVRRALTGSATNLGIDPDPENGGSDGPLHYLYFKNSKVSPVEDHAKATFRGAALAQQFLDRNQGLAAGSQGRVMGLPIGSVPMTPTWHGRGSRAMPSGVRVPPPRRLPTLQERDASCGRCPPRTTPEPTAHPPV